MGLYVFSVSVMFFILLVLITSVLSAYSLLVITSIILLWGLPSFKSLNISLLCKIMLLPEILGNLYMSHFLLTLVVIELGSLWLHSRSSGLNWKFQVQSLHQCWHQQLLAHSAWSHSHFVSAVDCGSGVGVSWMSRSVSGSVVLSDPFLIFSTAQSKPFFPWNFI